MTAEIRLTPHNERPALCHGGRREQRRRSRSVAAIRRAGLHGAAAGLFLDRSLCRFQRRLRRERLNTFNNLVGVSGGKVKGAIGGVQIGYNYQLSPMFVVGIENDFEGGDIKNHDALNSAAVSLPWYMTGRARAGIATMDSRLLFFGTAGLATGELKDGPINKMKMGWTAGGGVEWAFLPKWSAKAEYLYTEFKHDNLPDWNIAKLHSFRVGVNYHFDLFR